MTNKRFNALAVLNPHEDLSDDIDLVEVSDDFVSLHDERYQFFQIWSTKVEGDPKAPFSIASTKG